MSEYLIKLMMNSLLGSLIFLFFQVFRPVFKKYRYSMFRTLWILLAVFLLNPFEIQFPNLTQEVKIETKAADSIILTSTDELVYIQYDELPSDSSLTDQLKGEQIVSENSSLVNDLSYFDLLSAACIAIGVILFVFQLFGYFWFHRLLKGSSIEIGREKIPVLQSELVDSPLLTGILHPVIALPSDILEHPHLDLMILHELTHYQHLDLWVKFLWMTVRCFHWMNPLVYWMEKQCSKDLEMACDEAVLKDASEQERQVYAQTLLDMVSKVRFAKAAFTTQFSSDDFKVRIRSLFETGRKKFGRIILAFVFMYMASTSAAFTVQIVSEEPFLSIYKITDGQPIEYLQIRGRNNLSKFEQLNDLIWVDGVYRGEYQYQFEFDNSTYQLMVDDEQAVLQKDQKQIYLIKTKSVLTEMKTLLKLSVSENEQMQQSNAPLIGRLEEGPFQEFYYIYVLDELKQINGVQKFVLSDTMVHITSDYTDIRYFYYDRLLNFYLVDYPISYIYNEEDKNAELDMTISFWDLSRPYFDGKLTTEDGNEYLISFDLNELMILDAETESKTYGQPTKFLSELNQKMTSVIVNAWNQCVMQYQVFTFWQDQMMAAYENKIDWSEIQDARNLTIHQDNIIKYP